MEENKELFRYKNIEEYKLVLNSEPQQGWLKSRSIGMGREVKYSPISIKESLADRVFREWVVVDEKYMNVLNEIVCTVKIQALPDYPNAEHIVFTGSASKPIQVDAGSQKAVKFKPHEFPKGKKENALEYCLPAVRSEAIGNAFETLGNIFGRNIARYVPNNFGFELKYKRDGAV